jgi:hypothetical protein
MTDLPPPAPPGHLDELLTAYLDGEVDPDERAEVEAHLATCAFCRAELEEERAVRGAVRDLPPVDAPFGLYERLLRDGPEPEAKPRKRRIKFGLANLVATAAAWVLVLGIANFRSNGSVDPAPAGYVAAHASVLPDFPHSSASKQQAEAYDPPDVLAGTYELAGVSYVNGIPQLVYTDGQRTLSMFVQPGHLNEAALPSDAQPVQVNGAAAWQVPTDQGEVVFLQRPGVVVVIVGPATDEAASDVATSSGPKADQSESVMDHVRGAAEGLLETFGFQG